MWACSLAENPRASERTEIPGGSDWAGSPTDGGAVVAASVGGKPACRNTHRAISMAAWESGAEKNPALPGLHAGHGQPRRAGVDRLRSYRPSARHGLPPDKGPGSRPVVARALLTVWKARLAPDNGQGREPWKGATGRLSMDWIQRVRRKRPEPLEQSAGHNLLGPVIPITDRRIHPRGEGAPHTERDSRIAAVETLT